MPAAILNARPPLHWGLACPHGGPGSLLLAASSSPGRHLARGSSAAGTPLTMAAWSAFWESQPVRASPLLVMACVP